MLPNLYVTAEVLMSFVYIAPNGVPQVGQFSITICNIPIPFDKQGGDLLAVRNYLENTWEGKYRVLKAMTEIEPYWTGTIQHNTLGIASVYQRLITSEEVPKTQTAGY